MGMTAKKTVVYLTHVCLVQSKHQVSRRICIWSMNVSALTLRVSSGGGLINMCGMPDESLVGDNGSDHRFVALALLGPSVSMTSFL